jgi:hypothetical protein
MPRPRARRNRLAPQRQASSTRSVKPIGTNALLSRSSSENSDDSNGLVSATSGPHRPPVHANRDATMTGGSGHVDALNGHESTPKAKRTPTTNSFEYTIESSPPERTGTGSRPPTRARGYSSTLSLAGRKGDASSRIGGTPAFESSILSNFRRRPRQPSILQMMQADGSSDLDDDDFLGGFSPEDESTPLNVSRSKAPVPNPFIGSPSARSSLSSPSSKDSRKRKRRSMEAYAAELSPMGMDILQSPNSNVHAAASEPRSASSTASPRSPSLTMGPPLSSSPGSPTERVLISHEKSNLRFLQDKAHTVPLEDGKSKTLPKLATTTLQERFLPRRRVRSKQGRDDGDSQRDASEEDAEESAEDSSGEDELNSSTSRTVRRSHRKGLFEARSINAKMKSRRINCSARRQGGSKNEANVTKTTVTEVFAKPDCSQSNRRLTYSRRGVDIADKENHISDNSSSLSSPPPSEELDSGSYSPVWKPEKRIPSRELQQQARKFAEIDKWQMDFEDVSVSDIQNGAFR